MVETTQMSLNWWMDKQIWYIHIMEYNSARNRNEVLIHTTMDFPGGLVVKNLPANAKDTSLIPELG